MFNLVRLQLRRLALYLISPSNFGKVSDDIVANAMRVFLFATSPPSWAQCTHRILESVRKRIHCGIGLFCFLALPRMRLVLKLLWLGCSKVQIGGEARLRRVRTLDEMATSQGVTSKEDKTFQGIASPSRDSIASPRQLSSNGEGRSLGKASGKPS